MADLLETICAIFPRGVVGHLASRLGEGENGVRRAVEGAIPAVLGGLIAKVAAGNVQRVFDLSQRAYQTSQNSLSSVTGLLVLLGSRDAVDSPMAQGRLLVGDLFGVAEPAIVDVLSTHAGIRPTAARTLLEMVAAVLPAVLGQHTLDGRLSVDAAAAALMGLKGRVRAMLPSALAGLIVLPGPWAKPQWFAKSVGSFQVIAQQAAVRGRMRVQWFLVAIMVLAMASMGADMLTLRPLLVVPSMQQLEAAPQSKEGFIIMANGEGLPLESDF
jgi:hypothetical protein